MDKESYAQQRRTIMHELSNIAAEKAITSEDIAERTGLMKNNIERILAGKYPPSLDNLLMICDSLELKINFSNL